MDMRMVRGFICRQKFKFRIIQRGQALKLNVLLWTFSLIFAARELMENRR
jgi:hypothetical protein